MNYIKKLIKSIESEIFIIKNGEMAGKFDKLETSANSLRTILEK